MRPEVYPRLVALFCAIVGWSDVIFSTEIDVTVTSSGVKCRDGRKCTNKNYWSYYCYLDDGRWDLCCNDANGCAPLLSQTLPPSFKQQQRETFCSTSSHKTVDEGSGRCRTKAENLTMAGVPCDVGEFCGYYGRKYQWCWTNKGEAQWDYCCFPGSPCKETVIENHVLFACKSCHVVSHHCHDVVHPCQPRPVHRSIHNYACVRPCSQGDRSSARGSWTSESYGWCYVKKDESAWDWCCALGETCGRVRHNDASVNSTRCYVREGQRWPMDCKKSSAPDPVPEDFRSPITPTDLNTGEIVAIVVIVAVIVAIVLHFVLRRLNDKPGWSQLN